MYATRERGKSKLSGQWRRYVGGLSVIAAVAVLWLAGPGVGAALGAVFAGVNAATAVILRRQPPLSYVLVWVVVFQYGSSWPPRQNHPDYVVRRALLLPSRPTRRRWR